MIPRHLAPELHRRLAEVPAVAVTGPRQSGKTTLALAGAEIDLLLAWPDGRLWAVEIKRSLDPRPRRGFHVACADLVPERRFVIYPGTDVFPLANDTLATPLDAFSLRVAERAR